MLFYIDIRVGLFVFFNYSSITSSVVTDFVVKLAIGDLVVAAVAS